MLKMMVGSNLKDQQLQQIVDKTIMEADLDHDGKISFEEFQRMVENTDVSMSMTLGEWLKTRLDRIGMLIVLRSVLNRPSSETSYDNYDHKYKAQLPSDKTPLPFEKWVNRTPAKSPLPRTRHYRYIDTNAFLELRHLTMLVG